jgi:acetyl esterase/lipase
MRIRAVIALLFISLFIVAGQAAASTPVTLSLTSSNPASIFAQDVTFTVTTDPAITGTVSLQYGRVVAATIDVVDGVGTWTSDTLPARPLLMWATCQSGCEGMSEAINQNIDRAGVNLKAAIESPLIDAGATTRINVTAALIKGEYVANGKIDISENDVVLATGSMTAAATFEIPDLPSGEHVLTVRYYGNQNCYDATTTLRHTVRESQVTIEPLSVFEGNDSSTPVPVVVRLTGKSSHEVDVEWKTADGSGVAGRDYEAAGGTLTFAPGETKKEISVNVFGNTKPEPEKTFTIVATGPENVFEGVVHIVNDDPFFERKPGLAYGPTPDQVLDLYVPLTGNGPYPLIVGIEAIDFVATDPSAKVTLREAERGYVVAKVSFRPDEKAPFPAQINDLRAAVRWLRANATQYNIDPNRIGVWGIGAGGHLAALLGTTDESFDVATVPNAQFSARVQAVVDWYGEIDFAPLDPSEDYGRYLGCAALDCPDVAAAANAATYVTPGDAPLLIVQGADDTRVPVWTTQALYVGLINAGVDARITILDGVGHGGAGWDKPALLEQVDRFFDEKLKQ